MDPVSIKTNDYYISQVLCCGYMHLARMYTGKRQATASVKRMRDASDRSGLCKRYRMASGAGTSAAKE
jgi:hypothetical protein